MQESSQARHNLPVARSTTFPEVCRVLTPRGERGYLRGCARRSAGFPPQRAALGRETRHLLPLPLLLLPAAPGAPARSRALCGAVPSAELCPPPRPPCCRRLLPGYWRRSGRRAPLDRSRPRGRSTTARARRPRAVLMNYSCGGPICIDALGRLTRKRDWTELESKADIY